MKALISRLFPRHGSRGERTASATVVVVGLGSMIALLGLSLLVVYSVLEVKTGIRAYVSGESLWSKGKEDSVYFFTRFIDTGDSDYLDRARDGLLIPLGDLEARLALESTPRNPDVAREGFLQGGNHPDDVPRLIWLFRYFQDVSEFQQAISIWRATDQYIKRLDELMGILEEGADSPERLWNIKQEVDSIREELRPLEKAFSEAMGVADRRLNTLLFVTVGIFLSLVAMIAMLFFWWAAKRVSTSESELRAILEHAGVGMAMIQRSGRVQSANGKLCEMMNCSVNEIKGRHLHDIMPICDRDIELNEVVAGLAHDREVTLERSCVIDQGQHVWLRFNFSAMGENDGFILVVEDISDERSRMDMLAYEATHDQLTGLLNRREFHRRLKMALETARSEPAHHVICAIDLDRFKEINDSCGHAAGDEFLISLGEIIRRPLREGDVLARMGGDEFAAIFSYCPMDVALKIAEQLRDEVSSFQFEWEGQSFQVTLSAGLVELGPQSGNVTPEHILEVADSACYWAKQQGRNRVYAVPSEEML